MSVGNKSSGGAIIIDMLTYNYNIATTKLKSSDMFIATTSVRQKSSGGAIIMDMLRTIIILQQLSYRVAICL
jgi:hypothetical protein